MKAEEDVEENGAIHQPRRLPVSNFVISGSGARNNHPSLSNVMLLCTRPDVSVPAPCIQQLGCCSNNVNSLTDAPMLCPVYGVEQIHNE